MSTSMTKGSPLKLMLQFALPLLMGNLLQQTYNIIDAAIVGQILGADALASVGSSSSVQFLVLGFCIGCCAGFGVPVARYFGAGDHRTMRNYIFNGAVLTAIIAAILMIACSLSCGQILHLLSVPDNIFVRSAIPVLEGILLKAEGFQLTLTGYDLEMGIVTTIEANVKEPGEIVLNAKLLSSMISRMPAGQISILSADNGKTTIKSGVAEFEIQSMAATDFPDLPNTGAEETLTIPTGVLRDMIDRTLYAVSQDEKKPAHTGELFEIEPDKLTIVALDGYRLAIVERPVTAVKDIRIIVPSKTMTEVAHLLPNDDEEPVHVCANRRYVVFMAAGYTIMSRLIEGEFLNYHNVIPAGSRTRVTLDTKEFIETIERASLIITERLKNPLRITFTEGKVVVRCQTNLGRVVDEFNAQCEGDEVEIGFNNRYLLDALRNARTEQVRMEISGPLSPVKVLPVDGSDFLYLVLPVRFKND